MTSKLTRRKYAHGKMATDEARKCLQQIIKERELLAHMAKNWDTKKFHIPYDTLFSAVTD